ncbi:MULTISPECIES: DUF1801 domain-containing protein [unclassified Cryobacterium]|uniref:DUF1801 domain-containing protein n=1 Tax=unclassified Cryobacterium TaxID=2649013 RepID=UPI00106A76DC|nr:MULTISPECIES: DUF1801 domain-containing protein [unclassified Cryobacterium]TFC54736.1 DUF1801 domain-containing protein [Cryobacterium sp. TMB3-1-2]TFC58268.1 DUF1801 domain-containing protein [Cryobacterium sp. TMB1-7]TFC71491.1 DUF1801 domain-containing protein [Cryobacterium sp. TMB3-15]TFC72302.1 DUF1801 domain-containing protein [Cryobacterium sp. TMB3-10]TFD42478.1 DUF1801 domain-containing protein [Cryobacterium sp. TMB3-12]
MSTEPKISGNQVGAESAGGFSAEERAAMKARAAELKADARRGRAEDKAAADEATMMAKIAEMKEPDRQMAVRLHGIVTEAAPELLPKLYYGQPGWAKAGKVVVFFRSGQDDKERYSTLGFSAQANLDDDGGMWPTSYALRELNDDSAATIAKLVATAAA